MPGHFIAFFWWPTISIKRSHTSFTLSKPGNLSVVKTSTCNATVSCTFVAQLFENIFPGYWISDHLCLTSLFWILVDDPGFSFQMGPHVLYQAFKARIS